MAENYPKPKPFRVTLLEHLLLTGKSSAVNTVLGAFGVRVVKTKVYPFFNIK